MKTTRRIKPELTTLKNPAALISAGVGALAALICMVACGNYYLYSFLLLPRHAPPAFLFFLSFILTSALLFYSAGLSRFALHCRCRANLFLTDLLAALFFAVFYISFMSMAAFPLGLIMLLCGAVILVFGLREAIRESAAATVLHILLLFIFFGYLLLVTAVILLN